MDLRRSDYLDELEVDLEADGNPLKFGSRGRIGRGGRLVIDRCAVLVLSSD